VSCGLRDLRGAQVSTCRCSVLLQTHQGGWIGCVAAQLVGTSCGTCCQADAVATKLATAARMHAAMFLVPTCGPASCCQFAAPGVGARCGPQITHVCPVTGNVVNLSGGGLVGYCGDALSCSSFVLQQLPVYLLLPSLCLCHIVPGTRPGANGCGNQSLQVHCWCVHPAQAALWCCVCVVGEVDELLGQPQATAHALWLSHHAPPVQNSLCGVFTGASCVLWTVSQQQTCCAVGHLQLASQHAHHLAIRHCVHAWMLACRMHTNGCCCKTAPHAQHSCVIGFLCDAADLSPQREQDCVRW
jgi:hypothetical protein